MYEKRIVEEMLKSDQLLAFRFNMYINLEGYERSKALRLTYDNVILNDVYRLNRYKTLKARNENEKDMSN